MKLTLNQQIIETLFNLKLCQLKLEAIKLWPELDNKRQINRAKVNLVDDIDSWGEAWIAVSEIKINVDHLGEYFERTLNEVICHEFCHLIIPLLYPGIGYTKEDAHAIEWQNCMKLFRVYIDPADLA